MKFPKWTLFTAVLLFLFLLAACSPNQQPTGLTPIPSLAPKATETLISALDAQGAVVPISAGPAQGEAAMGAAVYMKYCSQCHGNLGQGVTGPGLRGDPFIRMSNDQAVFTKIALGDRKADNVMPGWLASKSGPLVADDINNVVAYLRTIQSDPTLPTATPLPIPPTETPLPAGAPTAAPPEPARPSNEGEPGPAVNLVGDGNNGRVLFGRYCAACHGPEGIVPVPNPGSDDGVVPSLNPIDPTIADADLKTFASNVDLYIEHGSTPSGPAVQINMPDFGDKKLLTAQQIADIMAYLISLNPVQ